MLVELEGLEKSYRFGDNTVRALRGLSLSIPAGAFVALMGASGSGKTSLLNIIGCLDAPTGGRYRLDGTDMDLRDHNRLAPMRTSTIGFVFQSFNLLPVLSALKNVELPMLWHPKPLPPAERHARARQLLETVGLGELLDRRPSALSGGQQQRVAIARAFANRPRLVLADEPTANLDTETADQVLDSMVRLWREEGATFLLATHDPRILSRATEVVYLVDGVVGFGPMHDPESHLFNRPYFEARLSEELRRARRSKDPLALVTIRMVDESIKTAAPVVRTTARASDTTARVHRDVLAVLLAGADEGEAFAAARRIESALSTVQVRAQVSSHPLDADAHTDGARLLTQLLQLGGDVAQ